MSLLESLVLGIVQGLTEFLPISSTAHLRIIPALCGWKDPGAPFTAVTQIGTLAAVLVYYRKDLGKIAVAFTASLVHPGRKPEGDALRAWGIAIATVPIAVCGLLFQHAIETSLRSLTVISIALIALAAALALAELISRKERSGGSIGFLDMQIIGAAQALALVPGVSRSGVTLTAGLFRDLRRDAAASFSFLLSIPAVALSGAYQVYELRDRLASEFGLALVVATVSAGVVGYASIAVLLRFLRTHSTGIFIVYRIALGLCILLLLRWNVLS